MLICHALIVGRKSLGLCQDFIFLISNVVYNKKRKASLGTQESAERLGAYIGSLTENPKITPWKTP